MRQLLGTSTNGGFITIARMYGMLILHEHKSVTPQKLAPEKLLWVSLKKTINSGALLLISCLIAIPSYAVEKITTMSNGQQTAFVELYTSEGCSSCPPADQWFQALIELPREELDVLALAFHVDYWDYLGWKDRFGNPKHTSRQRLLGEKNHQQSIYTPEFFVDGVEARGTKKVIEKIRNTNNRQASIQLKLSISKTAEALQLELQSGTPDADGKPLQHRFFVYENQLMSDVKKGENSGERLFHQQVVRYMSPALNFKDTNQYEININPQWRLDNIGVAALVTAPGNDNYLQVVHSPIKALLDR